LSTLAQPRLRSGDLCHPLAVPLLAGTHPRLQLLDVPLGQLRTGPVLQPADGRVEGRVQRHGCRPSAQAKGVQLRRQVQLGVEGAETSRDLSSRASAVRPLLLVSACRRRTFGLTSRMQVQVALVDEPKHLSAILLHDVLDIVVSEGENLLRGDPIQEGFKVGPSGGEARIDEDGVV
jgi:hypothetical protein